MDTFKSRASRIFDGLDVGCERKKDENFSPSNGTHRAFHVLRLGR